MTKKLRFHLAERIGHHEDLLAAMEERLDGIVARIEWLQIEEMQRRRILADAESIPAPSDAVMTTEKAWATPAPRLQWRFLNGSWRARDGDTYPPLGKPQGPLGGYESYVRRSPPATE